MKFTPVATTSTPLRLLMVPTALAACQAINPAVHAVETAIPPETILRALPVSKGEGDSSGKNPEQAPAAGVAIGGGDYVHWNSWTRAGATEAEFSYGMELLAPLWHDERSVLFLYPELGALDAGRQSYSLGIGGRVQLDSVPIILGANFFYDHSEGFANQNFDQLGAGIEVLSDWWEFRANGYLNLSDQRLMDSVRTTETTSSTQQTGSSSQYLSTGPQYATGHSIVQQDYYRQVQTYQTLTTNTTRVWENFSQPMSGVDAEFGVLLPGLPKRNIEARLFIGGYYYRNPFGGKDVAGAKARAEVRLWDRLYLDGGWAQDEEVMGGNWYAGIRVNVPFGAKPESSLRLSNGLHPLTERLNEAVQRNARPVVATSGYRENVELRDVQHAIQIRRAIRVVTSTQVVQDKIDFVNNGQPNALGVRTGSDKGDGTAEHPHDSIVAGAAQAAQQYFATGHAYTVMVNPTAWAYQGNVLINAPMHLTGAPNCGGILHAGLADVGTGGNPNYTVGFTNPLALVMGSFTAQNVAGKVEIDGFIIRQGGPSGAGVQLTNVAQSSVHCNNISVPGNGVEVVASWADVRTDIYDNILNGNGGHGIMVTGQTAGHLSGLIAGNDVSSNGGHGIDLRLQGGFSDRPLDDKSIPPLNVEATWDGNLENNRVSNNAGDGFHYEGAGRLTGNLVDNFFNENQGAAGVEFANSGSGLVQVGVAFNDVRNNSNGGIYLSGEGSSQTIVPVLSNNLDDNGSFGYRANLKDTASLSGDVQDNNLANNQRSGVEFSLGNQSQMNVSLLHNDAHGSGTDGISGYLDGGDFNGNIANNNLDANGRHGLFVFSTPGASNSIVSGQINNNEMSHNAGSGLQVELHAGNFSSSIFANNANQNTDGLALTVDHTTLNLDVHDNHTSQNANSGITVQTRDGSQIWGAGISANTLTGDNPSAHNPAAALDVRVTDSNWNAGNLSDNLVAGSAFRGISLDLIGNTQWSGDLSGNRVYNNAFAPYRAGSLSGSGIYLALQNSGGTQLNLTDNTGTRNGSGTGLEPLDAGLDIWTNNHPGAWVGKITGNAMNENLGIGIAWRSTTTGDINFTGDFQHNTARDNEASGFLIISGTAPITIGGGSQTGGNSSLNNGTADSFTHGFGL